MRIEFFLISFIIYTHYTETFSTLMRPKCKLWPGLPNNLENNTLGLVDLLDINIPNDGHTANCYNHDDCSSDEHVSLGRGIRSNNSNSLLSTHLVAQLDFQALVDILHRSLSRLGQQLGQLLRQCVGPDSSRNTVSNRTTNVAKQIQHSQYSGDVVVLTDGHDGDLLSDDNDTTSQSNEDLTHDGVSDGEVGLAEVDHQADTEDVQRYSDDENPLESTSLSDQDTDNEEIDSVDDVEDAGDVTGRSHGHAIDNLQVGSEVSGPAVVGDLVCAAENAGSDDVAVLEQVPREEGDLSDESFPNSKGNQKNETNDKHGDDVSRSPFVLR